MINDTLDRIKQHKLIAIIRGVGPEQMEQTLRALHNGGIKIAEITLNSPDALQSIAAMREMFSDELLIGAGTVLTAEQAEQAVVAGADFVLAPSLDTETIRYCNEVDVLAIPGIFTPTEAVTARNAGAKLLKVFPADSVGPAYIKALQGPLDDLLLLPVGGVDLNNAAEFLENGAVALGIGSCLVNKTLAEKGDFAEIERRARAFCAVVSDYNL